MVIPIETKKNNKEMNLNIYELKTQLDRLTLYVLSLKEKFEEVFVTNDNTETGTPEKPNIDELLELIRQLQAKVANCEEQIRQQQEKVKNCETHIGNIWNTLSQYQEHIQKLYDGIAQDEKHITKIYARLDIELKGNVSSNDKIEKLDQDYEYWYEIYMKNKDDSTELWTLGKFYWQWREVVEEQGNRKKFDDCVSNWYNECKDKTNQECNDWWTKFGNIHR